MASGPWLSVGADSEFMIIPLTLLADGWTEDADWDPLEGGCIDTSCCSPAILLGEGLLMSATEGLFPLELFLLPSPSGDRSFKEDLFGCMCSFELTKWESLSSILFFLF